MRQIKRSNCRISQSEPATKVKKKLVVLLQKQQYLDNSLMTFRENVQVKDIF